MNVRERKVILKNIIADRLKIAREHAGLSQREAAQLLGVHRESITELEHKRRDCSAQEMHLFAEIYDADIEWLLGLKDFLVSEETLAKLIDRGWADCAEQTRGIKHDPEALYKLRLTLAILGESDRIGVSKL